MSIIVTGATGHLGRLAVESLLKRGVPGEQIVATGRKVDKIDDLAARGVGVRSADFARPETLGQRVRQHANAVDAAKAAGVELIVDTSAPRADTTPMLLAAEHRATEELIRASPG